VIGGATVHDPDGVPAPVRFAARERVPDRVPLERTDADALDPSDGLAGRLTLDGEPGLDLTVHGEHEARVDPCPDAARTIDAGVAAQHAGILDAHELTGQLDLDALLDDLDACDADHRRTVDRGEQIGFDAVERGALDTEVPQGLKDGRCVGDPEVDGQPVDDRHHVRRRALHRGGSRAPDLPGSGCSADNAGGSRRESGQRERDGDEGQEVEGSAPERSDRGPGRLE
jgi:hypothetical protein